MTGEFEVDGVDYSPEAIEEIRSELVFHRNESMKVWPEGIRYSVLMSHVLALLARLKEYEAGVREKPIRVEAGKRVAAKSHPSEPKLSLPPLPPQQGSG